MAPMLSTQPICAEEEDSFSTEKSPLSPESVSEAAQRAYPKLEAIECMLGSQEALDRVGYVDCLIMYDILLHQVAPDWDQFLLRWSSHTKMMVIWNQNWTGSQNTIRFIDKGLEWFKNNVFYTNLTALEEWFARHGEYDQTHQKMKRDIDNFWQWGIVERDILNLMSKNGFTLAHSVMGGPVPRTPWIVNQGMIFVRTTEERSPRLVPGPS